MDGPRLVRVISVNKLQPFLPYICDNCLLSIMIFSTYHCHMLLHWKTLEDEVTPGSNTIVNISNYIVSFEGLGSHSIPAEMICQESSPGTCSYLYPIPSLPGSTSGIPRGHVAAESDAGRGEMCSTPELQQNREYTIICCL